MTSADDAARAVMRTYADTLQPPPVAEIIGRAERTRNAPHLPSSARPRFRGRLVLTAASVAAVIAVVAIAADRLPDRGATAARPTATQSTPSQPTRSLGAPAAPGCPPAVPVLDGPRASDGTFSRWIAAKAGQQLTLTGVIPATTNRDQLLSFRIYLLPHGARQRAEAMPQSADRWLAAEAISQSAVLRLAPGQHRVSLVLQIPTGLAPATYDIFGYGTFPSPSVCGVTNPAPRPDIGSEWGVLGWVVVK